MTEVIAGRGRRAVATSILGVALLGGYLAASMGGLGSLTPAYLVHAVVLGLGFWFPAMKIRAPRDVPESWPRLLPWILGWTLAWDLATAALAGGREPFEDWWIVYPAGVLLFSTLLLIHGYAVSRRAP